MGSSPPPARSTRRSARTTGIPAPSARRRRRRHGHRRSGRMHRYGRHRWVVASKRGGDAADNGGGRGVGCWNDGDVGDHSQLRHGTTQSGVYDVIQTFQHGVLNDRRLLYCKRVGRARGKRNGNGRCGPGRMDRTARRIGCERGHVGRMPTVSAVRVCVGGYGRSGRETDVIGVRMRNDRARRFSSASGRAPSSDRLR